MEIEIRIYGPHGKIKTSRHNLRMPQSQREVESGWREDTARAKEMGDLLAHFLALEHALDRSELNVNISEIRPLH